ncbi:hypothetical protein ACFL5U_02055 [Candidatus Margulisiibacteriota bacterium]
MQEKWGQGNNHQGNDDDQQQRDKKVCDDGPVFDSKEIAWES